MTSIQLGRAVRKQRRAQSLRQSELASIAGVGIRFISELENGKQTLELGRVIKVMETVGLCLEIKERSNHWPETHVQK